MPHLSRIFDFLPLLRLSYLTDYAIMTAPNTFQRPEELIDWLRANQEKIILNYFRRCFSK
jgi:hypothetical protein